MVQKYCSPCQTELKKKRGQALIDNGNFDSFQVYIELIMTKMTWSRVPDLDGAVFFLCLTMMAFLFFPAMYRFIKSD